MSPANKKAKTTRALHKLKQKHSDSGYKKSLSHVSKLTPAGSSASSKQSSSKSKSKRASRAQRVAQSLPETFHDSTRKLTPAHYQEAFRKLYGFFFFLMSLLLVWIAYRGLTNFPVWLDEGVAKAIIFGIPVFWFAARSRFVAREIGLDIEKLIPGLYLGIAIGGLYGFAAILVEVLQGREVVQAAFYLSNEFWWMAFLAFLTAWWESLFFFGLPIQYIRSAASWMSENLIAIFVIVLFLLFHAPLRLIVAGASPGFLVQMGVLTLFVIGQYVVYQRTKNMYALVLSHLFWGLVIEIYN